MNFGFSEMGVGLYGKKLVKQELDYLNKQVF